MRGGGGRAVVGRVGDGFFLQKDMDGEFDYKQTEGSFCKKAKERPGSTSCDRSDGSRRASSPVAPRVATGKGALRGLPLHAV